MLIIMQESCVFFNTHNPDGTESEHPLVFTFIYREFKAFLPEKRMLGMRCNLGNKAAGTRSDIVLFVSGNYGSEMFETFLMGQKDISRIKKFFNQSYTDSIKFDATISVERKINHCIIVCQIYVSIHTVVQLVMIPIFAQRTLENVRYEHLFAYTSLGHSWNDRKIHQVKVTDGKYFKIMNSDIIDHKTCCRDGGSINVKKADSSCTESLEETKGSKSIVNDFNEKIHRKRKRRYKKRHALQKADLSCTGEGQARPKEIKSVRNDVESHPVCSKKSEKIHRRRRRRRRRRRMYTKNCTCQKVVIIILMFMEPGRAYPINPNWSTPLLTTPRCNINNLNYLDTCQNNENLLNLLLQQCDFKCDMGYTAKCVNTLDGVSSYICLPENLSCQKGVRLTAQINTEKPSEVIIREEKCPNGTFQSNESHCFDGCSEKHRDIGLLGETYRLHSYGDNVNPTIVYCNYEKGFYSTENKTWIDFDRESKFNPFLCQHVDDFNPCSGKMAPLPNATCVSPCLKGQCRDAHDNFICKEICRQEQGEDSDAIGDRSQDKDICNNILDACKNGKCNSKGDCECYKGFTYDEKMQQCKEDKRKEKQSYIWIVTGPSVCVGVGLFVFLFVYWKWRRHESIRRNEGNPESRSLTSTTSAEDHQSLSLTSTSSADLKERNSQDEKLFGFRAPAGHEFAKPQNDCMTQQMVSDFNEYMKSVGALMYRGDVAGTVFRAGDKYLLTPNHVIRNIVGYNNRPGFDISRLETEDVFVNFNSSVGTPPRFSYKVQHVFSSDDPRLDFAVLKVVSSVELPKKMFLYRSNYQNLQVQELSGIGYGNPENVNKKHLDPRCRIILNIKDKIDECKAWMMEICDGKTREKYYESELLRSSKCQGISIIQEYTEIDTSANIFVDISLQHGGSGSPFLTTDGKVVGMLTHGSPEFFFHLPPYLQCLFPKNKRFEGLLRLDLVFEHISKRDPELAKELFG